ncbi:MAG: GNAT family N-acetyltransferase, partial [bacterium]|nr:GNAT family N-acetyltransferase [bacterium]
MHVDAIDDYAIILDLKQNWEAVYSADPEAQYFLSWPWMSKWLKTAIKSWVVLAVRPVPDAGDYVAFFPLRIRTSVMKSGTIYNSLSVACEGLADYSGFICRPDAAADAIPAFAQHIKSSTWRNFSLAYFCVSDERSKLLVDAFPRSQFKIKKLP